MKRIFLGSQEALLHGDLHTGSVFVHDPDGERPAVRVFDSEFAFYGPIGYDIGSMWGNLLAAAARAAALGETERARSLFANIETMWDAFIEETWLLWPDRVRPEAYPDSFLTHWLDNILADTIGFAGCEATRRIIGLAKMSDIESLDDTAYERAARLVLLTARSWLRHGASRTLAEYRIEFERNL